MNTSKHIRVFSPRTRGCSYVADNVVMPVFVFPAHAGMFRRGNAHVEFTFCFPRARGDVPRVSDREQGPIGFSPRTRGCSDTRELDILLGEVFPAHAGMFQRKIRLPHRHPQFSPRTRGCSGKHLMKFKTLAVFPAHAGMFLQVACEPPYRSCFPRARGDVPARLDSMVLPSKFSPRTRGCSAI